MNDTAGERKHTKRKSERYRKPSNERKKELYYQQNWFGLMFFVAHSHRCEIWNFIFFVCVCACLNEWVCLWLAVKNSLIHSNAHKYTSFYIFIWWLSVCLCKIASCFRFDKGTQFSTCSRRFFRTESTALTVTSVPFKYQNHFQQGEFAI